jgi:hypothetical protein
MDVVINEVVSTVRMLDSRALLDEGTLGSIVRAVLTAVDDSSARERRRSAEVKVEDDGRGGIAGMDDGR